MKQKILVIMTVILFGFLIAGCQSESEQEENNAAAEQDNTSDSGEFPLTIDHEGKSIEIPEKPERILPMSLDVADIVLELVDPSKIVAIPSGAEDPILSSQTEKAKEVENHVSSATSIDPEEILSYDTDLLLLTTSHGQEEDASNVLSETELPILSFDTASTVDAFLEKINTIGEAVGEKEKADEVVNTLQSDIEASQAKIPDDVDTPSVLILSEVGPGTGPYMLGPGNISYDIIQLAGATPAVDSINLESSTPASIEQVMQMDPDYIFLLDFTGEGETVYTDLTETPGWSSLTAVEEDNLRVLDIKYLMTPNADVIEGLDMMVDWIYELEE